MSVSFTYEYLSTLDNNIEWTTELPIKEGFYWVKDDIQKYAFIVGVEYDDYLKKLVSYDVGWDCRDELELMKGLKWYGPLTLPKE